MYDDLFLFLSLLPSKCSGNVAIAKEAKGLCVVVASTQVKIECQIHLFPSHLFPLLVLALLLYSVLRGHICLLLLYNPLIFSVS